MVLPVSMAAAVLSIVLQSLLRRLSFVAVLPSHVLEDPSVNFLNPQTIIAGAGAIGSVFCYLIKNRHQKWKETLRNLTSIKIRRSGHQENHRIVEKCIERAKTRVDNRFQGSRKLQQNAMLFVANRPEDVNFPLKINKNASRFIHTTSYKKLLMTDVEVEEPAGTSDLEMSDVQSESKVLFQQELHRFSTQFEISSTISNEMTQSRLPDVIINHLESNDMLSENYDSVSEGSFSFTHHNLQMGMCIICERKQQNGKDIVLKRTRSGRVYGIKANY